jgi:hypothetical protein
MDVGEAGMRRNQFKLKDFRGVDPRHVTRLEALGIKTAAQMLVAGCTPKQRAALAREARVPEVVIVELTKLADLARLPGVKGIRARLYHDAGVDCVAKMATWEPEPLRLMLAEYVQRTGFDGIAPLPKEVSSTVANARKLPKAIEV